MPVPWEPYDGIVTYAATWALALLLGNDRAPNHHTKQKIRWDATQHEWRIQDVSQ